MSRVREGVGFERVNKYRTGCVMYKRINRDPLESSMEV